MARTASLSIACVLIVFTLASGLLAADAQWELNGDLTSSTGQGELVPLASSPAVDPEVTFEIESIAGQDAEVAHFSRGTYLSVPHGMAPNGGGGYVNQYTLIMDVMFPDRSSAEGGLVSLFQTNCCNQNDGDWFINADGGLGVASFGGSVPEGEWHRIALVADLVAGTLTSYVDGVAVHTEASDGVDGRFSLYSPTDTDADPYETFFVFADESGSNAEGFVNSIQFHDLALSGSVLAEIGGPSAAGIPRNVCIFPAAVATRDIGNFRTAAETNADYLPGDVIDVSITLSDIRVASPPCTAPAGVVIVETLPTGWTPSQITEGGVHDPAVRTITWTVQGAALTAGKTLGYKVTAAASPGLAVDFAGTLAENLPGAKKGPVLGESSLLTEVPFDTCGGIRCWNILGGYSQGGFASPGLDNLRLDYLTDGSTFETDLVWFPGAQIATAFGGDGISGSASTGLQNGANGRNPSGVPEVFAWNDRDSFINLNDDVFGGDPNGVMGYMQCYITNPGADRDVMIASDSDDSIQIKLNGEEVWANSVGRGSTSCQFRDISPDGFIYPGPITLASGENILIVKVFEGDGGWNGQVRLLDPVDQQPITDVGVAKVPSGVCTNAPLRATRDIGAAGSVRIQHETFAKWDENATYSVSIAISDIRAAGGGCGAASNVRVEETLPEGWTPSEPSAGGVITGRVITWTLTNLGGAVDPLTYRARAPSGPRGVAAFRGKVAETGSPVSFAIVGESVLQNPASFTAMPNCFVTDWLLLGPYLQPAPSLQDPAANPRVVTMQRDHLCDGAAANELDIEPRDGDVVNTTYGPGGCARSIGLAPELGGVPINPDDKPTWYAWRDQDDLVGFGDYYGGDIDRIMMYAVAYVDVADDITVDIGLDSDDSIQVLLDGAEIWVNSVARGMGVSNSVVDTISSANEPALDPLTRGRHKLMVKVFEGGGSHGFRLRFQDPATSEGICEGISICLEPNVEACATRPTEICTGGIDEDGDSQIDCDDPDCAGDAVSCPQAPKFHRGDSNNDGNHNISDPVNTLNVLFLGSGAIPCQDAADSNDDGQVNISDPVNSLNVLFLGTGNVPPPLPPEALQPCGVDPTADAQGELGCASYTNC